MAGITDAAWVIGTTRVSRVLLILSSADLETKVPLGEAVKSHSRVDTPGDHNPCCEIQSVSEGLTYHWGVVPAVQVTSSVIVPPAAV